MSFYDDTTHHVLHQVREQELARRTGEVRLLASLRTGDPRAGRHSRPRRPTP